MTIQDLFSIILAKIKFIILMAVLGGVIAFCVAEFLLPIKYSTSVKIYVKSSSNSNTVGEINVNELNTARTLAETYIIILDDISIYERISNKFAEEYDADELSGHVPMITDDEGNLKVSPSYIKSCVSISSVNESEVLLISATTEIPQLATDICNYMVDVAPDVLRRVTKAGSVEEISAPKLPTEPSSPNVEKITVMGVLIGIIGSMAIVILLNYFNNKIVASTDIRDKFGVPVLAEIPNFESKNKKGVL